MFAVLAPIRNRDRGSPQHESDANISKSWGWGDPQNQNETTYAELSQAAGAKAGKSDSRALVVMPPTYFTSFCQLSNNSVASPPNNLT